MPCDIPAKYDFGTIFSYLCTTVAAVAGVWLRRAPEPGIPGRECIVPILSCFEVSNEKLLLYLRTGLWLCIHISGTPIRGSRGIGDSCDRRRIK